MFLTKKKGREGGMTYLELIVVLSIFAVISSISIFSYKKFQAKVDLKNLTNDIALKVVEAQKLSVSGKLSPLTSSTSWKPSYGIYFDVSTPTKFVYFTDLNNSGTCDDPACIPPYSIGGEVTDIINITRGNYIPTDGIRITGDGCPTTVSSMSIVFRRPNSAPIMSFNPNISCSLSFVSINFSSSAGVTDNIKLYPSGRIQIN